MNIATEHLCFSYTRSGDAIIDDLSIRLTGGTMVGLTGPSGSGKSTLLFLLALLLRPSSGTITIDGQDICHWSDAQRSIIRRDRCGFLFQDAVLDPTRSVIANITEAAVYGASTHRSLRTRAHHLLNRFDVDIPAHRRPGQISGGQAQRIALCRALINQPDVIFADEPTASLDRDNAIHVIDALQQHATNGGLAVVASHDPDVVTVCDTVIEL